MKFHIPEEYSRKHAEGDDKVEITAGPTPEAKAAKLLGRKGGRSKSEAKAVSSRANGKLGGRPKRQPDPLKS